MCLSGNGGAPQEFVNGYWEIWLVFAIRVAVATLLGAAGCLIGSVTAVLWYLVVWAGLIVFCGVFVYGIPALAVLLGDWIDALGERRRSAREARRR